ncbi:recombinase family protein [Paracoccaceae bacterium]|nr:recombinase family protein [Paracoccaceae bacterium]
MDESADVIFHFSITYRRPLFTVPQYPQHQFFLYEKITAHREKGKTFDHIAEWLNKKGYLSVGGKQFKGNHVHSIVKKKRLKDEKLEREYPEVWSDFRLEVVDKTLVNMFEGSMA